MPQLVFKTPQEYLNYDFDDNYCFFFEELRTIGEEVAKVDVDSIIQVDFQKPFIRIIHELFEVYEQLIIDTEYEQLLGVIGKTKMLIKEGPKEES